MLQLEQEPAIQHTPTDKLLFSVFVVGKVTSDSARLLLEISPTSSLPQDPLLTLKGDDGSFEPQALSEAQKLKVMEGKPVPFIFRGLSPESKYSVVFHSDMKTPDWLKDIEAGFSTFPIHLSLQNDRRFELAFYSCSKQNELLLNRILPSQDLFEPLNKEVPHLDLMLHLGDNVYLDEGHPTAPELCAYCVAEALLRGKPADVWKEHRKTIEEHFREVYRRAWSHPSTAKALAQVPNFFVPDDHEIINDFGYPELDQDPSGVHAYLAELAYEVLLDYELQPMMDIVDSKSRPPFFTAESFGDVGLLILDLRMEKHFMNSSSHERFLGSRQWQFLREVLQPGGSLDNSKMLLVGMPMPLAYIGSNVVRVMGPIVERSAELKSQLSGMWVATPAETQRLLDLLKDWKLRGDREVIFVAGDVHHGMLTDVTYNGDIMFKQVTSSAMANTHLQDIGPAHSLLDVGLRMTSRLDGDLGQGWAFTHQQYIPDNNYGRLSAKLRQVGEVEKATAMISLKVTDNAHGHKVFASEAAGCDHDTGGTCYITWCRSERNAVCTNSRCKCQENQCAENGRCVPW
jgi:phosphodiesterase/alkaline phosphatase D-like protein